MSRVHACMFCGASLRDRVVAVLEAHPEGLRLGEIIAELRTQGVNPSDSAVCMALNYELGERVAKTKERRYVAD